jgi:defect-in-organelle-trafficking protein DotB
MQSDNLLLCEPLVRLPSSPKMADFDEKIYAPLYESASDIYIVPGWYVVARINGRFFKVTERKISADTMTGLIKEMTSVSEQGDIIRGIGCSWIHRISSKQSGGKSQRFRCEGTSGQTLYGMSDIDLVMRPVDDESRDLKTLGLPEHLIDNLFPTSGLVLISGPTGSGKTTLLSSAIACIARWPGGKMLTTLEDPIEVNHHGLEGRTGVITQAELGRNFKDFPTAMKALLRKHPDVIVCGELRDNETIQLTATASNTGHAVYGTIHTNSASTIIPRIAGMFPAGEQPEIVSMLIKSARVFAHQLLYTNKDGNGVVPVLEYIAFTETNRGNMDRVYRESGLARLTEYTQKLVDKEGQSLVQSARKSVENGKLDTEVLEAIEASYKVDLDEQINSAEESQKELEIHQKNNMDSQLDLQKELLASQKEQTKCMQETLKLLAENQKVMTAILLKLTGE